MSIGEQRDWSSIVNQNIGLGQHFGATSAANTAPSIKEPGLCTSLAEASKYVDELYGIFDSMEIKLRKGIEKSCSGADGPGDGAGAITVARTLAQRLAGLVGYGKTMEALL